jgi:hypothetical protein
MTATYDGKLILREKEKRVEPCCENMHTIVTHGSVKITSTAKGAVIKAMFAQTSNDRIPLRFTFCPFCGAKLEVS